MMRFLKYLIIIVITVLITLACTYFIDCESCEGCEGLKGCDTHISCESDSVSADEDDETYEEPVRDGSSDLPEDVE